MARLDNPVMKLAQELAGMLPGSITFAELGAICEALAIDRRLSATALFSQTVAAFVHKDAR